MRVTVRRKFSKFLSTFIVVFLATWFAGSPLCKAASCPMVKKMTMMKCCHHTSKQVSFKKVCCAEESQNPSKPVLTVASFSHEKESTSLNDVVIILSGAKDSLKAIDSFEWNANRFTPNIHATPVSKKSVLLI